MEDLRTRLLADPPPPEGEIREALARIADLALAAYPEEAPASPPGKRPAPRDPS
ncbi:hypothetical protein [Enterovirga sp.]|uniref:hypothetical protein n=1 Tax=Enterovirga sp. TaxID=2026350 RepID=UPI002D02F5B8|nr:hypothetical protein [Enterovirga sp.]HMO30587.1 hypothetical protein [Enterovirga sp.]